MATLQFNMNSKIIYKNLKIKVLVFGFVFSITFGAFSQGLGNSPYSALGLGQLYSNAFSPNNAMGDAGVSTSNFFYINALNPALLVRNRYTTFDVGIVGQYHTLKDPRQSQKEFAGNLGYFALAFPASPKWTLGLSLKPYSYVNYKQNTYGKIGTSIYEAQYTYEGTGGFNTVNLTNGFSVGKRLSLGIETSFLFGGTDRSSQAQLKIGDGRDYLVKNSQRVNVSDLLLKVGAAWQQPIKKGTFFNMGMAYSFAKKLSGKRIDTYEVFNQTGTPISTPDTLSSTFNGGILSVPQSLRVGVSYEKFLNLLVSLDYQTQAWSGFTNVQGKSQNLRSQQSVHLGVEYMPKFNSSKYFDLVWYRAGLSYNQTPLMIGTKPINDMNVSFGFGFPIGREKVNMFNVSLVLGQRGDVSETTFRERYTRIVVGLSLKDEWFKKYKVQ